MLLVNGVHMLINIVIVNPTQVDLVSKATISCEVVVTVTVQMKDNFYHDHWIHWTYGQVGPIL